MSNSIYLKITFLFKKYKIENYLYYLFKIKNSISKINIFLIGNIPLYKNLINLNNIQIFYIICKMIMHLIINT